MRGEGLGITTRMIFERLEDSDADVGPGRNHIDREELSTKNFFSLLGAKYFNDLAAASLDENLLF